MSSIAVAPLAVWDAAVPSFFLSPLREEAFAWAIQHCGAGEDTHRIEFWLADVPFARVFRYARDEEGCRYRDPATGSPAEVAPADVVLGELPPEHLMRH